MIPVKLRRYRRARQVTRDGERWAWCDSDAGVKWLSSRPGGAA